RVARRVPRAAAALAKPADVERPLAVRVDAVPAGRRRRRDDLVELRSDIVRARRVVERDPAGEAVGHEARVDRPAQVLAVVVRTGTAGEEAETVRERGKLRPERVGDTCLEPADHPGAPAAEEDAALPRLPQHRIEAVRPPDGEHVHGVAAADVDHVVRKCELAQAGRRPRIEVEGRDRGIELRQLVVLRRRRVVEEHPSPAREREHVLGHRCVRIAAEDEELGRGHGGMMTGPSGGYANITAVPTYVYDFDEPSDGGRELLGGKGIGLAEMTQLGVPVPAGFTITTDACRAYLREGGLPDGLEAEVAEHITRLEQKTGKRFGDHDDPLLVSVRSGAAVSMPGMMDTILNLGLNDDAVEGLAQTTGNARFALDSYRRLIQMYGEVVDGIDGHRFEQALTDLKRERGAQQDVDLTADDLGALAETFKQIYEQETGGPFPAEAREQLRRAVRAVFESWQNPRAHVYRRTYDIPDDIGTAVNVVQMVFGNKGERSATGVCFTRDPSTGEQGLYGEYLVNAQGEDVVAGIRTPQPIEEMRERLPEAFDRLVETMARLEQHYRDMQDIEFTIEDGTLYLLQTRSAKRTAAAALKAAVDMAGEGLISRDEAIARIDPGQLDQLLHPMLDPNAELEVAARGLNASPGAACGHVVLDADTAEERGKAGEAVILVRWETTPDDIHGVIQAKGVLTAHGGMTSHAAVVARGMGK